MSEYGRFFTNTRHIPTTFGNNPATGERLPGGPYTAVQVFGGMGVGVLMWMTNALWGTGVPLLDLGAGLAAMALTTWLLRYAPDDLTELWTLGIGASKILDAPRTGSYEGKPFKIRKAPKMPPGLARIYPTQPATAPRTGADPDQRAQVSSTPTVRRHLGSSSVDRLLAHTTSEESPR
ncbi:hypothetical protein ACIA8I_41575 [Streptomyces rishiriensis]|uniref:hypothetical protein n=1 Tax=Streptomyces rishiriensis TaxID=68264 RepID=UPI003795518E